MPIFINRHLSCWLPAISANYSASSLQLVHLFFLVDELRYDTPESLYTDETSCMSRSLQDYNFNTLIQPKGSDRPKPDNKSFDGLALNQQRATKVKIVFKIIDQRVHLKAVVMGNLSWDGQKCRRGKKPFVVINEDSASVRSRPFLFSDITKLAGRKNGNLVQLNASCLVPSKHLPHLDVIIINTTTKSEVNHKSVPGFVSVEDQSSSVFTPKVVTSLEHVNETELHNEYQGKWLLVSPFIVTLWLLWLFCFHRFTRIQCLIKLRGVPRPLKSQGLPRKLIPNTFWFLFYKSAFVINRCRWAPETLQSPRSYLWRAHISLAR